MKRNVPARRDVSRWSETRWLGTWNPSEGVGLFLHAGRFRHNIDLWWVQTVVYLPDGEVAVDRSWGRAPDESAVRTSVFELVVAEPGARLTARFDGAAEICTVQQLAERPRGSGGHGVGLYFELEARAMRPEWDIYDQLEAKQAWADGGHVEQHHAVTGALRIGDETYSLDGLGFDDHSHGVRAWDGFGSHIFFNVPFDGFGLHLIAIQTRDGAPAQLIGAVTDQAGGVDPVDAIAVPLLEDLLGAPQRFDAALTLRSGRTLKLDIQVVHTFQMTITDDHNDNINGLDWDVPGDPLMFCECIARFTTTDGDVSFGHLERSARRSRADRDTLRVRVPWALT